MPPYVAGPHPWANKFVPRHFSDGFSQLPFVDGDPLANQFDGSFLIGFVCKEIPHDSRLPLGIESRDPDIPSCWHSWHYAPQLSLVKWLPFARGRDRALPWRRGSRRECAGRASGRDGWPRRARRTDQCLPPAPGFSETMRPRIKRVDARCAELGWHLDFLAPGWLTEELLPIFAPLRCSFTIAHMGMFRAEAGPGQRGYVPPRRRLRLGEADRDPIAWRPAQISPTPRQWPVR